MKTYVNHLLEACQRTFNKFDEGFYSDVSAQENQEMIANLAQGQSSSQHLALVELKEMYGTGNFFPGYPIKRTIPNVSRSREKQCSKKIQTIKVLV